MVAVYAKTKDDFSAVAVHRISSSLATPAVEALIINNSQQEQCKATYYIRLPQGRGCYLTVDPRITTVATLKQTISHRCGIPLTLVSLHWQGATLDQWQHSRISLLDIGLISGDTLHLRQPIKGGVQPMTRNQKRGHSYLQKPRQLRQRGRPYWQKGHTDKRLLSDTESDDSVSTSLTTLVASGTPDTIWQARTIKRRPIMSKLTTHVYLSNDIVRVATLNINGAL